MRQSSALRFTEPVDEAMHAALPGVAERVVAAVVAEVPSYSRAFSGPMGETIRQAVAVALGGFLIRARRAGSSGSTGPGSPRTPALSGAYDLGRGEARSGRSMDSLLAAYRVGARVAWRGMSEAAVGAGLPPDGLVSFAEMVFAYIDELSAASVAGHADELETTGRVLQRLRARLGRLLVTDAPADAVHAAAARADWEQPETLVAVLLPPAQARGALTALGAAGGRAVVVDDDVPDIEDAVLVLVPDLAAGTVVRLLAGRTALVGPAYPWLQARESFHRVRRAHLIGLGGGSEPVDTAAHLSELVRCADEGALAELRDRALAPLQQVRPSSRDKLEETLRLWLLCQGRREQVAALLYVHPQTVRYRVGQLRELFGERLEDPGVVLELVLALGGTRAWRRPVSRSA